MEQLDNNLGDIKPECACGNFAKFLCNGTVTCEDCLPKFNRRNISKRKISNKGREPYQPKNKIQCGDTYKGISGFVWWYDMYTDLVEFRSYGEMGTNCLILVEFIPRKYLFTVHHRLLTKNKAGTILCDFNTRRIKQEKNYE